MDTISLKQQIEKSFPEAAFADNKQFTEVIVPAAGLHDFCLKLRASPELQFDYLISLTAVDWNDHLMLVCHINSTVFGHTIVVKSKIEDRENPAIDTLSDIWKSSEFHECEVYDMFGIKFNNHPDLRRLFLEDDYGFPLRKDFSDETRMIVK